MFRFRAAAVVIGLIVCLLLAGQALAQTTEPSAPGGTSKQVTMWDLIKAGGAIGHVIILISVASTALIVEHFMSIRRERFLPPNLVGRLQQYLNADQVDAARQECQANKSFLASVIDAGLGQAGGMFGYFDMQAAMQEVSEREVAKFYRKIEYLAYIAGAAPMLGLLGTVTGMISSFNVIASTEGSAKPSQLAQGIWEALVTTVEGLVVAIPVMFFVSFFRSRIETLVAETEVVVDRLMGRFRKGVANVARSTP